MPIQFSDVIVFSAGGFVGYLGRQLLEHKLAIIRNFETIKATEFNKAAAEFRAAFVDAIFLLRQNSRAGNVHPGNILNEPTVVGHEKAKIMFEPFLAATDLKGFDETWKTYRYGERNRTDNVNDPSYRQELCNIYLAHLEALLKYAEPKSNT